MAPSLRAECVSAILVEMGAVSVYRCCVSPEDNVLDSKTLRI
jgi:hypothetical protein